jgi:phosphatidylglycerophosphate synthase
MDRRPLKTRSRPWAHTLALGLVRLGVAPNAVSVAGIAIAAAGGWLLAAYPQCWIALAAAAVCIQLRLLCNMLDGLMAVEGRVASKDGTFFNEVPDRIEDVVLLVGAGWGAGVPHAGWLAAVLAVTTAYLRAFGGSLGLAQDYSGPGAKPHRMFVLTLGCVAGAVGVLAGRHQQALAWSVIATAVLAALTVVRRAWRLRRSLLRS